MIAWATYLFACSHLVKGIYLSFISMCMLFLNCFLFLFGSGVVCLSILLGTVCFYLCNSLFKIVLLDLFWDEVIFQAMHLNPSDLEFVFGHWHAWIMYIFHIDFVGVFCFGNRFSSPKKMYLYIYIFIYCFLLSKWNDLKLKRLCSIFQI